MRNSIGPEGPSLSDVTRIVLLHRSDQTMNMSMKRTGLSRAGEMRIFAHARRRSYLAYNKGAGQLGPMTHISYRTTIQLRASHATL